MTRTLLALLLLASSIAPATQAAIVLYNDRASWQNAAGGGTGDIYDTMSSGT